MKKPGISGKAYGRFDVRTANAYNNLGKSYAMIGEDEKSINNKKIALEIRRKVLGPMHADVAASCMNLGYSYATMGQYDVAEEYYAEATGGALAALLPVMVVQY